MLKHNHQLPVDDFILYPNIQPKIEKPPKPPANPEDELKDEQNKILKAIFKKPDKDFEDEIMEGSSASSNHSTKNYTSRNKNGGRTLMMSQKM